jgi:hypothetical protein
MPALRYAKPREIDLDVSRLQVAYDLLELWCNPC